VLPTYNERENIAAMIARILQVSDEAGLGLDVLVVDDASPDGTGELADAVAAGDPRVRVLHRAGKEGLGRAYVAGFRDALARDAGLIFEIDADFSHEPSYLPAMVALVEQGADIVLGSRYVRGGGVGGWGLGRRVMSRGGCLYAQAILALPYHDLTGGFKCFRRRVLETLDLEAIGASGYGFQIETTWRAHRAGFRIVEMPFVFIDRRAGQSKMSGGIAMEAALMVWRLRFGRGDGAAHARPS
jgi:dolichol-phosphate mannosyltransferase